MKLAIHLDFGTNRAEQIEISTFESYGVTFRQVNMDISVYTYLLDNRVEQLQHPQNSF